MSDGHNKAAWAQTSAILAMTANVHRDPSKTKSFSPSDFNPFTQRQQLNKKPSDAEVQMGFAMLKGFARQWRNN